MSVGPTPDVTGNIGVTAPNGNKMNSGDGGGSTSRESMGAAPRPLLRTLPASAIRAVAIMRSWLGWPGN